MRLWTRIITLVVLIGSFLAGGSFPAEALSPGEPAITGQTYYITGRDVWIRDEPNTDVPAVATYRFGEPVVLLGTEGTWAHVRLVNGWDRYVHMDYVGTKEVVQAKLKPTTECMLTLDRIYDDAERLMESMYPNGPGDKAPKPEVRKASCASFLKRIEDLDSQVGHTAMPETARRDIRGLAAKVRNLVNFLQTWENGGEDKYTPYFLDEFVPEYDRVGDLYR